MAKRYVRSEVKSRPSRGLLLLLLPLPALFAALVALGEGQLSGVLVNAGTYVMFLVGALLNRQGLREEAEYHRRRVANPPSVPWKGAGAGFIALATGLSATLAADYAWPLGICFAIGAYFGCHLLYGPDPRQPKTVPARYGVTTEELVEAIAEGERSIRAIEASAQEIENRELRDRLQRIVQLAHRVLGAIEERPRDLRRARKFLTVYLEGAQRVTEGYARSHKSDPDGALEGNFRRVLITIEDVFEQQHRKLLQNDLLDLDVQIEVLSTQLKREGVA